MTGTPVAKIIKHMLKRVELKQVQAMIEDSKPADTTAVVQAASLPTLTGSEVTNDRNATTYASFMSGRWNKPEFIDESEW